MGNDYHSLIVSFYTPGDYETEVNRLRASLNRLDLAHHLERIKPALTWLDAVRQKPYILAEMRVRFYGHDLLYVDADAYIHRDPWFYFETMEPCDIGVHYLGNTRLQSGTIYLPDKGEHTDLILRDWIEADRRMPETIVQPQKVLEAVLDNLRGRIRVARLPSQFCWIVDISDQHYDKNRPIIEHLQASREYRLPGQPSGLLPGRRKRIKELTE